MSDHVHRFILIYFSIFIFCNLPIILWFMSTLLVNSWHCSQLLLSPSLHLFSIALFAVSIQWIFIQWNLWLLFTILLERHTNIFLSHVGTGKCIQYLYLNMWLGIICFQGVPTTEWPYHISPPSETLDVSYSNCQSDSYVVIS